jgi:hypothetical protein
MVFQVTADAYRIRRSFVFLVGNIINHARYSEIRQLVLHRIKSANLLEQAVMLPEDFDLDEYIAAGGFGYSGSDEFIELVATFTEAAAAHLHECPMSEDQDIEPAEGGFSRVSAAVPDTMELCGGCCDSATR